MNPHTPWWLLGTVCTPIAAGVWFILFEYVLRPRDPKPDDTKRLLSRR